MAVEVGNIFEIRGLVGCGGSGWPWQKGKALGSNSHKEYHRGQIE